jgi:hypothetical protein
MTPDWLFFPIKPQHTQPGIQNASVTITDVSYGCYPHHRLTRVHMQDELMLVFQDAHFDTQLNRYACFTFTYPYGIWLKYGEYFFGIRRITHWQLMLKHS